MKNPYGIINGKLIHINDIQKGERVLCPNCKEELIVREGEKNIKHLAHKRVDNVCTGGGESLIHKLTKQYIYENINEFEIEKYDMSLKIKDGKEVVTLSGKKVIEIKEKYIEYRGISSNYIPDLYFILNENIKIAIEICYSNAKNICELNEILKDNDEVTQVYEIKITENDILDLNLSNLLKKARLIYNRNENVLKYYLNEINKLEKSNENLRLRVNISKLDDNKLEYLHRVQLGSNKMSRKILVHTLKNNFFRKLELEKNRIQNAETILEKIRTHMSGNFGYYINSGNLKNFFYIVDFYEQFINCETEKDYTNLFNNKAEIVGMTESNSTMTITCNKCGTTSNPEFLFTHDGDEIHDFRNGIETTTDGLYHWFRCSECGNEIVLTFGW